MWIRSFGCLCLAVLLLAGCGQTSTPVPGEQASATDGDDAQAGGNDANVDSASDHSASASADRDDQTDEVADGTSATGNADSGTDNSAQEDPSPKDVAATDVTEKEAGAEAGNAEDAASQATADDTGNAPGETADAPVASRRVLMFGADGPLLVELIVTIDGEAFDQPVRRLIDEVMAIADSDGDGVATWDELLADASIQTGVYGNQPVATMAERQSTRESYDGGDGRVDRYELLAFLSSNQRGSRAFSLTSSNQYRGDNQTQSLAKRLLDWDEDERLSASEMENAPVRLRSRDNDEDDILFLDDLKAASNVTPQLGRPNMQSRRKRYGPDAAVLVDNNTNWTSVLVSLQELYTVGGSVGPEPFAMSPSTFAALDTDENGLLTTPEMRGLLTVKPHLVLAVRLGSNADGQPEQRSLELMETSKDFSKDDLQVSSSPGRLSLTLPSMDVLFYAVDATPQVNYQQQAEAQLMQLDTDGNGYVDKDELEAAGAGPASQFEALDLDSDGKLFVVELQRGLERRQSAARGQVSAYAADQEDALFSALDTNNDGRLTTREIDGATETLMGLDRNKNGELSAFEIPGSMMVGISRGSQGMMGQPQMAPPATYASNDEETPAWFRQMDGNQDGEVSTLEFLGDTEQFELLDANADGFIDGKEATRTTKSES